MSAKSAPESVLVQGAHPTNENKFDQHFFTTNRAIDSLGIIS